MNLKKQLVKISKAHLNSQYIKTNELKEKAEKYYPSFCQRILEAAKTNYQNNSCYMDALEEDIVYFEYLKQMTSKERIFLYLTQDGSQILVRWSVNQHE